MSSSVYIPSTSGGSFTPPASVSVKTASYTIPAGRYARIVAECDSGGTLTINAVTAITTAAFVNIDVYTGAASSSYTTPTNYKSTLSWGTNGNPGSMNLSINGNVILPINQIQYDVGPSGTMSVSNSGFSPTSIQGVATPSNATERQATFYVPTGTVISGTGNWRAVVEEYTV